MDVTMLIHIVLNGVVCTGVAYSLLTYALKYVDAGKAVVIISLELVWPIAFSVLWFAILPDSRTIYGGCVIIIAVIISAMPGRDVETAPLKRKYLAHIL
jgi:drug/metabolite transporter (DMT)-like permease